MTIYRSSASDKKAHHCFTTNKSNELISLFLIVNFVTDHSASPLANGSYHFRMVNGL